MAVYFFELALRITFGIIWVVAKSGKTMYHYVNRDETLQIEYSSKRVVEVGYGE